MFDLLEVVGKKWECEITYSLSLHSIYKYSNRAFINNVEPFVRAMLCELESTIESLKSKVFWKIFWAYQDYS